MPNTGNLKVTTPNPNEIMFTRTFNAPWRMVYDAFTKPELIKRWFGAKRGTLIVCDVDLRVGGKWRYVMRLPNGKEMGMSGVYKEIAPPDRMVHTEAFDDYPGDSEISTRFVEAGGRTTVVATCRYSSPEVRDAVIRSGMSDGAAESYDALAEVLTEVMFPEVKKVAFTMYPVKDTKRARAFYEGTLGLTVGKHSDSEIWTEYDLPGGGCFARFKTSDIEPSAGAGGTIAFEVVDLDALNTRLKAAGVAYKAEMIRSPVCRMSVILDTEGNSILLHQLHQK